MPKLTCSCISSRHSLHSAHEQWLLHELLHGMLLVHRVRAPAAIHAQTLWHAGTHPAHVFYVCRKLVSCTCAWACARDGVFVITCQASGQIFLCMFHESAYASSRLSENYICMVDTDMYVYIHIHINMCTYTHTHTFMYITMYDVHKHTYVDTYIRACHGHSGMHDAEDTANAEHQLMHLFQPPGPLHKHTYIYTRTHTLAVTRCA